VDTAHTSTVTFPSGIFSLERDETFPYERFAYNLLDVGVEALHEKNLPESLTIDFAQIPSNASPWTINSSILIQFGTTGLPTAFRFHTPELVPSILYQLVVTVISDFLDEKGFDKFRRRPGILEETLQRFVHGADAGIRAYRERGIGHAIRASYNHLGLTMSQLKECGLDYDLIAKQIAYHEIAHAYVEQMTSQLRPTQSERRSFELVADLVATQWMYQKMIANTPDTSEYRRVAGLNSYAETILANTVRTLRAQQGLLIVMALAGAQRSQGSVTLAGGKTHPSGVQRFLLQHTHLYTLIRSNFSTVLSQNQFDQVDADWDERVEVLIRSGLLPVRDIQTALDETECETAGLAAELVEKRNIKELKGILPLLRSIRNYKKQEQ